MKKVKISQGDLEKAKSELISAWEDYYRKIKPILGEGESLIYLGEDLVNARKIPDYIRYLSKIRDWEELRDRFTTLVDAWGGNPHELEAAAKAATNFVKAVLELDDQVKSILYKYF